jgi:hypothetical protein
MLTSSAFNSEVSELLAVTLNLQTFSIIRYEHSAWTANLYVSDSYTWIN